MVIPKARFLALVAIVVIFAPCITHAKEDTSDSLFRSLSLLFMDAPSPIEHLSPKRPKQTNAARITRESKLRGLNATSNTLTGCLDILPYDSAPVMKDIGRAARIAANNSAAPIEKFEFQPHFSGLKGPKLTIMRSDLERALIHHQGSANEIYHNAEILPSNRTACTQPMQSSWDLELNHRIDAWESDEAPLVQSNLIINNHIQFAGYFMGTLSTRLMLHENLSDDKSLYTLNRTDPVRQDVIGYTQSSLGLSRILLSGFVTPLSDFYVAGHAGYLEEMFFGLGGEFLYRPYGKALSIGAEAWRTVKRVPYQGGTLTIDDSQKQSSALLNLWLDIPHTDFTLGSSAGWFLDGDLGYQIKTIYKPADGWRVEGYATYSTQSDATISKQDDTHWIIGARLTMPLGKLKGVPDNSKQTFTFEPFARDHGQRLDNPYPLYDITDKWQARNIIEHWSDIAAD